MGRNGVEGATNLRDITSLAARLCDIPTKTQWLKPSALNISFMSAVGRFQLQVVTEPDIPVLVAKRSFGSIEFDIAIRPGAD